MIPELVALVAAAMYAVSFIVARRGLRYSTPATVTAFSMVFQAGIFSAAVAVRGMPDFSWTAVALMVAAGSLQPFVRQLTYRGMQTIGAARSGSLRATHPFWAGIIAISLLGEELTLPVFLGNVTVVAGIAAISSEGARTTEPKADSPRWYVLVPLAAAVMAGIAFPLRRAALTLTPEPVFFTAVTGTVGLALLGITQAVPGVAQRYVWDRRAFWPFIAAGLFEGVSAGGILYALNAGEVIVIAPITATLPMWILLGTVIFLRDMERVTRATVLGTVLVVTGIILVSVAR